MHMHTSTSRCLVAGDAIRLSVPCGHAAHLRMRAPTSATAHGMQPCNGRSSVVNVLTNATCTNQTRVTANIDGNRAFPGPARWRCGRRCAGICSVRGGCQTRGASTLGLPFESSPRPPCFSPNGQQSLTRSSRIGTARRPSHVPCLSAATQHVCVCVHVCAPRRRPAHRVHLPLPAVANVCTSDCDTHLG